MDNEATPAQSQKALGRTEKFRILVDKVLMANNRWIMGENQVREIAEAGFNVVSPRQGGDNMDEVRKVAKTARKYGIFHMPWMRGSLVAKGNVKRVWEDGYEQDIASPNSDELWDWMTGMIVNYARISVECLALIGVFLDYENYSPGHRRWECYNLSYDDKIVGEFAASRGLKLPGPRPKDGGWHAWLAGQGLQAQFADFQVAHWRARCRSLRQAVDKVNPAFQFCVYPAPGDTFPFMDNAVYPEWATMAAPLILADRKIYGRSKVKHRESLESNRELLRRRVARAKALSPHIIYTSGIDPIVRGADPEFSGRNAAMISAEADGYWVFYEGPTYASQGHRDYWQWFKRANQAIINGTQNAFANGERETPDPAETADAKSQ